MLLAATVVPCVLSFLVGFLVVALYVSWQQALRIKRTHHPQWQHIGCSPACDRAREPPSEDRLDRRLTGAGNIDEQLQKVVECGLRLYLESWYHTHISPDPAFIRHARHSFHRAIVYIANRCKEADVTSYFSQSLSEDTISHLRLYKKALDNTPADVDVETFFFEGELGDDPWEPVCCSLQARQVYLQGLTEIVLCVVLPKEDFVNAALQAFVRDMLVWQVWLPLLNTLCQPDYINSLILSMCKDSSLTAESFAAAISEGSCSDERLELASRVHTEIEHLKKTGVTGSDQQKVSALESMEESLLQSPQDEVSASHDCPVALEATIPEYSFVNDSSGKKHVFYHIHVQCWHTNAPVMEQWTTQRRYTDFHDLHLRLRSQVGGLPQEFSLPTQRSLNKLDKQFVEARRVGLQQYLQAAVSERFLASHPQALTQIILFLSDSTYKHSSGELTRMVDSLVQPFRLRRSSSVPKGSTKQPVTSSPTSWKKLTQLPEGSTDEEDEGEFLHVLLVLMDEVFDVGQNHWLRRQLTGLLTQLVGEKVNRKVAKTIDWLTSTEQIAEYIRDLGNTLWPEGCPPGPQAVPDDGTKVCRALLARAKLIGSVPDDLKRFIGADRTVKGVARLFGMFQSETLNRRLALVLLEGLLDALFPERKLKHAFRELRSGIARRARAGRAHEYSLEITKLSH